MSFFSITLDNAGGTMSPTASTLNAVARQHQQYDSQLVLCLEGDLKISADPGRRKGERVREEDGN